METPSEENPPVPTPATPWPGPRFDTLSRFVLASAAVVLTLTSFLFQRADQPRAQDAKTRAEISEIRGRHALAAATAQAHAAQVSGSLAPIVVGRRGGQRERALEILAQIGPRIAAHLGNNLAEHARKA